MMTMSDRLAHRFSLIPTLIRYTIDERYRRSRFSLVLTVLEPIGIVALFAFTRYFFVPNAAAAFGTSNVVFYATGMLPFYLFYFVSIRCRDFERKRSLPRVTEFDLALSTIIGEFLTKLAVMVVVFGGLRIYGVPDALPASALGWLPPLLVLVTLGIAVGFINVVINSFFAGWIYIFAPVARATMAFSGVFTVVDRLPYQFQLIMSYNPFAQCITWFRSAFYYQYPDRFLDIRYLLVITVLVVIASVVLFMGTKRDREGS